MYNESWSLLLSEICAHIRAALANLLVSLHTKGLRNRLGSQYFLNKHNTASLVILVLLMWGINVPQPFINRTKYVNLSDQWIWEVQLTYFTSLLFSFCFIAIPLLIFQVPSLCPSFALQLFLFMCLSCQGDIPYSKHCMYGMLSHLFIIATIQCKYCDS